MRTERGATRVTLRPAQPEDSRRVWAWRNDPETRRASFGSAPIALDEHEAWFRESLGRRDRRLYIVLAGGSESGVVRLDISGQEAEVSIHLAPECRGRGMGIAALQALADMAFGALGAERLRARIKRDNSASLAAFRKAGFDVIEAGDVLQLVKVRCV
jgi:RimJ/RimL family protein N-acetyltransferase